MVSMVRLSLSAGLCVFICLQARQLRASVEPEGRCPCSSQPLCMQLAHFLQSDAEPWASRICNHIGGQLIAAGSVRTLRSQCLAAGTVDAQQGEQKRAEQLLQGEPADIIDAVLRHHPVIQSAQSLAQKLAQLPPWAHLVACRSCQAVGAHEWPIDVGERHAWDVSSQMLAQLPEYCAVSVHLPAYVPAESRRSAWPPSRSASRPPRTCTRCA